MALRATLCVGLLALVLPPSEGWGEEEPPVVEAKSDGTTSGPGLRKVGRVRLNPEDIPEVARKKQLKRDASPLGRRQNANSAPMETAYQAMKHGRHFRAVMAIDDCNRAGQRDPRVQELAGAAWSALGHYDNALGAFRVASSGPYYEEFGVAAHADALRAFGMGEQAATLRATLLVEPLKEQAELNLLLEIADDYLISGDGYGAEEVLLQAYAAFPRASSVHMALAEAYRLQGDEDAAGFHRWLVDRAPVGEFFRELLDSARQELEEGRLHKAEELIQTLTTRRRQNVQVAALRVELLIAQGEPEYAKALLDNSYWRERADPELTAARVRILHALGDSDQAQADLSAALTLYPTHPSLQRAAADLR